MPKRILYASLAAGALLAVGCQSTKSTTSAAKQPAVLTLGKQIVPASEFAYVYRKNNATAPDYGTRANVTEYLDLYTNFKLKVLEAEQRGIDTTQAFQRELDGYKQQLAQPYLTEKSVTDQLVREAYDRLSKEISASHILVRIAPDADPRDTLAAYQKAVALRQRVTSGEDFNQVARQASEDPSARDNGGQLGYFTAMQMVYPFENVAYKTKAGEISAPVRTRFGYHVIKVNDVRPAQGEIKVAHLMIRATPGMPKADSVTAKKKVDELYSRLRRREDWDKLVTQFSEDAGSAANGGELPAFGTGRMIPSFEEVAFKLQKPGDIAAPVQTPYGWHIIKLIEKQPVPTFEALAPTLKSKVAKDSRSELNRAAFLKRIRQENQFVEMPPVRDALLTQADTALVNGRFKSETFLSKFPSGKRKKGETTVSADAPLFTIKGKAYPIKDFLAYVQQSQRPRAGADPRFVIQQLYDQYVDQSLTEFEKTNLDTKYEDYRMLVKEYRDGILLFQLMDEKVWSKALTDTVGLQQFFTANQANYQWGPRVQARMISAASSEIRGNVQMLFGKDASMPTAEGIPASVSFQARTATLTPASATALESLADKMATDTTLFITVTSYGKPNAATALARQRTERVNAFLMDKGIKANKILTNVTIDRKQAQAGSADAIYIRGYTRDPATIERRYNSKNPLAVQITQQNFQKGDSKIVDEVMDRGLGTYPVQKDGRFYAVTIEKVLPAGPKTLSETRGQATSDYQNYLEKQWLGQLRTQYPVQVNQTEVDKLVTK